MDLLTKIEQLHEKDKHKELVELILNTKNYQNDSNLVSLLSRAYNNLGDYILAAELLLSIKSEEEHTAKWNYRLGYSYLYMEKPFIAIEYLYKAMDIDDTFTEDCNELLEVCFDDLKLPSFEHTFDERAHLCWNRFKKEEAEIAKMIDEKVSGEKLLEKVSPILEILGKPMYFEIGKSDKYEISLTLEGEFHRVHLYDHFISRMPEEIKEKWNFIIGKQSKGEYELSMNGENLSAKDVICKVEIKEKNIFLELYCEKIKPLMEQNKDAAINVLTVLFETILGEICCHKILKGVEFSLKEIEGVKLSELPSFLQSNDIDISNDAKRVTQNYSVYEMSPSEDEDMPERGDIYSGSTTCMALLSDYYNDADYIINDMHNLGAVAGYFFFDVNAYHQRADSILNFRYLLADEIDEKASEYGKTLGGAVGTSFCYIDFISYDIRAFLREIIAILEDHGIDFMVYSPLRQGVEPIRFI